MAMTTGRLTRRDLTARRERAKQGTECFLAVAERIDAENARLLERGSGAGRHYYDPEWQRVAEEVEKEGMAAIEMIREGMPQASGTVRYVC